MRLRIAFGIHQLIEGQHFWIGRVQVLHHRSPVGHSDATLSAPNLRNISFIFCTDPAYKGAGSRNLLAAVMGKITERG